MKRTRVIAYAAKTEAIKDRIVAAAEIARPIQNMNENGAMEVKGQRRRAGLEAKRLAARLNTGTWDRFGVRLLRGGMPSTSVTLLQGFLLFKDNH